MKPKPDTARWKPVGQRLKAMRQAHHLTQSKLAELLACDKSLVSWYETGKPISLPFLIGLVNLGWDVTSLFAGLEKYPFLDYFTLGQAIGKRDREMGIVSEFETVLPFQAGYKQGVNK